MLQGRHPGRPARRAGVSMIMSAALTFGSTGVASAFEEPPHDLPAPLRPASEMEAVAFRPDLAPAPEPALTPEPARPSIPSPRTRPTAKPAAAAPLRADAGDDQIGLVGRRITVNGGRSTPRGELAYRWIPLAGPKMEQGAQEEGYYSFVPTASGIYRLGLVVASVDADGVRISEVDEVVVTVGEIPSAVGVGAPGVVTAAIDQMMQGPGAAAGRSTLEQAAGVFDAIAARAALYTNFDELSAEMTRRLDGVVPTDPNWRQFWSQGIFAPLTQHLVSEMLAAGLDLRSPQGRAAPLGQPQQERLERLFSSYAREFRSKSLAR